MLATLMHDPDMWTALAKIAVINIVLSGDNAVVIALACRSLPPAQQRKAFIVGAAGIVVLMTALTSVAALLMSLPWIQLAGAALLLYIGIKLLLPEEDGDNVTQSHSFWAAVRTIIIADIVMSLDNVLGMAGAAHGHYGMLFVGLAITMPLILFGSALLMRVMERFPIVVWMGAGLLGYVAGDMAVSDLAVAGWVEAHAPVLDYVVPAVGVGVVLAVGYLLSRRHAARSEAPAGLARDLGAKPAA
ncbi:MAG: TerC family protein [Proteobacteria bacterium]|nr:TerC family protein [Pseudomonadota bacterium]